MSAILPVYRRSDIVIERGEGCYLYSPDGTRYLDFATGIAVNALGHGHPHVVAALKSQADILWHCSNIYRIPGLERLAQRYMDKTFADKAFFCNSGTEAVEAGLKMIRKYQSSEFGVQSSEKPPPQPSPMGRGSHRYRVITMTGGFHGRSMTCISAGGNEVARAGYAPLVDGFDAAEFNNLASVEALIGPHTAGILVEPIQGEGGVREADPAFLRGLRQLCDTHGLLLMFDEVQCGLGRTGSLFAHQQVGVAPDILSSAKGIGNGFPLAMCLTTDKVASCMSPGTHGSTYGSNPLAMAVGNAVLDVMEQDGFFEHVTQIGAVLQRGLEAVVSEFPTLLDEVRGRGLMLGLRTKIPAALMSEKLRAHGLLTAPTSQDNVVRVIPPLIIEQSHVDEALQIIQQTCKEWA